jgi:hypothetical protein
MPLMMPLMQHGDASIMLSQLIKYVHLINNKLAVLLSTTMPTIKPSFKRMVSAIPDYFLASGNKNDFQESLICNLWLLLLVGYLCYRLESIP